MIVKGAAAETIFKYAVGCGEKKGNFPWPRVSSLEKMIDMVKNNKTKYAFSFETAVKHKLHSENLCDTLVAVPTHKDVGEGGYYSSSDPVELITSIDRALSRLVLKELPGQWEKDYASSPLSCGKIEGVIGYEVLVVIFALTVYLFLLKPLILVALSYCWSNIVRPDTENGPIFDAAHEYGSSSSSLWSPGQLFSTVKNRDETLCEDKH